MKAISILRSFWLVLIGFGVVGFFSCNPVSEPSFGSTVTDVDGNLYHTLVAGSQTWMIENLKATHYNDGQAITVVTDSAQWAGMATPACCWYNNDSTSYNDTYGLLYNWYAVNTNMLAPRGWHVATEADWQKLEAFASVYVYKSNSLAKILASTSRWGFSVSSNSVGNNLSANNSSGFSAIPGGYRINSRLSFTKVDSVGAWWCSDQTDSVGFSRAITIKNDQSTVDRRLYRKWNGFSIRCVKD